MKALAAHTWLLITLRHDLRGLKPERLQTVAVVAVLMFVVAWARFDAVTALLNLVFFFMIGAFNPRLMIAVMLISVGIDLVVMPLEFFGLPKIDVAAEIWHLLALCFCVFYRATDSKSGA